ncbi:MAG: hypothetical protein HYX24_00265 [Candidatus Aenigmarchaeota archaeon]|nr:hypothetical protein [Candidatus Aenigmarchaeota archaeon]
MERIILVRYGEIAIKSKPVRRLFENILVGNIRSSLKAGNVQCSVERSFGRIFIRAEEIDAACRILKKISGIKSYSVAARAHADIDRIIDVSLKLTESWTRGDKFAVKTHRVGRHAFSSADINRDVGEKIRMRGFTVDLNCPERKVFIDIEHDWSYVYERKIRGIGGLPVGSQGRVIAIVKDYKSIIAACMIFKRGCSIIPIFVGLKKGRKEDCIKLLGEYSSRPIVSFYEMPKIQWKKIEEMANIHNASAIASGEYYPIQRKGSLLLFPLSGLLPEDMAKLEAIFGLGE